MDGNDTSLLVTAARLATFRREHHSAKRRASSTKKKTPPSLTWPHEVPSPEELARAGFSWIPSDESQDKVQCFSCKVSLDGWEVGDVPLNEHLAHSKQCAWATALSVAAEGEDRDPMGQDLAQARMATFADNWPHENKKAWKPKTQRLVDAGWCYDPSPDADDGVTCFYCNLSLDGWEPKDNPFDEHQRRCPDCLFFALLQRYPPPPKAAKAARAPRSRTSQASRTSRLSTQSVQSTFSEAPSLMSLGDANDTDAAADMEMTVDESMAIDSTITSDTGKPSRKKAKAKATTSKGRKKTKKEVSAEPQPEPEPEIEQGQVVTYPTLDHDIPEPEVAQKSVNFEPEMEPELVEEAPKPAKRSKKPRKVVDDSHMDDASVVELPKKAGKGRGRAKKINEPEAEIETALPDPPAEAFSPTPVPASRISEDQSQLQSELQDAASFTSALQSPPRRTSNRGVKRTSDGLAKVQEPPLEVSEHTEEPALPKTKKSARAAPAKAKKGKKTAKQAVQDSEMEDAAVSAEVSEIVETKPKRGRKKKAADVVDTDVQMDAQIVEPEVIIEATAEAETEAPEQHLDNEFEQQESEVEAPMQDVDDVHPEGQLPTPDDDEAPQEVEYEPSPTPQKPRHSHIPLSTKSSRTPAKTTRPSLESGPPQIAASDDSPHSSDAENHPPSSSLRHSQLLHQQPPSTVKKTTGIPAFPVPPSSAHKTADIMENAPVFASPTKTTRVPLAPGTPNRQTSPSRLMRSPSKLGLLTSTKPWEAVDLEAVFLSSPAKSVGPEALTDRLLEVGGTLSTPERSMSVEEWVRWRADKGEERLRHECERMVSLFEREGGKARAVLEGINVSL